MFSLGDLYIKKRLPTIKKNRPNFCPPCPPPALSSLSLSFPTGPRGNRRWLPEATLELDKDRHLRPLCNPLFSQSQASGWGWLQCNLGSHRGQGEGKERLGMLLWCGFHIRSAAGSPEAPRGPAGGFQEPRNGSESLPTVCQGQSSSARTAGSIGWDSDFRG